MALHDKRKQQKLFALNMKLIFSFEKYIFKYVLYLHIFYKINLKFYPNIYSKKPLSWQIITNFLPNDFQKQGYKS